MKSFAKQLILSTVEVAFEVKDYTDFKSKYEMLNVPETFLLACEVTKLYVVENLGATEKIMRYCRTLLKLMEGIVTRSTGSFYDVLGQTEKNIYVA
jgi:hypothetical protein